MRHYLFYIPSFAGGGAERIAILLANYFNNHESKVSFVVNKSEGPLKELLARDIPLYELKPRNNFLSIFSFSSVLKKVNPDHIYCWNGLCPIIGVIAGLLTDKQDKVVISYRNIYCSTDPLGKKIIYNCAFFLTRLSYCTICISSDVKTVLVDKFKAASTKIKVILNPVDLEEIYRKSVEPFPESLKKYREDKPFILAVGRLVKQKDYPTLIRAFHSIHKEFPHDLVILGQGPLEKDIRNLVQELSLEDRVVLPGFLKNPYPVFRAASLLALSSSFEGFGNVIVESLAVGTQVVSTSCLGGPREILADGKYGGLAPVGDDKAFAAAMRLLLHNPFPGQMLQERAGDFSLDKVALQYQSVFD